jgi:hypothetical protein
MKIETIERPEQAAARAMFSAFQSDMLGAVDKSGACVYRIGSGKSRRNCGIGFLLEPEFVEKLAKMGKTTPKGNVKPIAWSATELFKRFPKECEKTGLNWQQARVFQSLHDNWAGFPSNGTSWSGNAKGDARQTSARVFKDVMVLVASGRQVTMRPGGGADPVLFNAGSTIGLAHSLTQEPK